MHGHETGDAFELIHFIRLQMPDQVPLKVSQVSQGTIFFEEFLNFVFTEVALAREVETADLLDGAGFRDHKQLGGRALELSLDRG
jgi:hypothetical protein